MTWVMWYLVSVRLETMIVSVQDWSTICAKCSTGSAIVLDAPDGTHRWRGSCGISLLSVWRPVLVSVQDRCMVCVERAIGSEIIWTHPMELLGDMGHVESHLSPFRDSVSVGAR